MPQKSNAPDNAAQRSGSLPPDQDDELEMADEDEEFDEDDDEVDEDGEADEESDDVDE
jgi:hypothetical protein